MAARDIDDYLTGVDEPGRSTLQRLRESILAVVPDADEAISYGMPAFKVRGKTIAGFAAFKHHLSYLPHSGSTLASVGDAVAGYESTKGSLHFSADEGLPDDLVRLLVVTRMREVGMQP